MRADPDKPTLTPTPIPQSLANQTLAAAIRKMIGTNPIPSWSTVRKLISSRKVTINGAICVDETRRLRAGETISIHSEPAKPPPKPAQLKIVYADDDLVVVDKPPGVQTLRRHEERHWDSARKALQPTLDELIPKALKEAVTLHPVHRLDRDTSGLMLFALNRASAIKLIRLFKKHAIERTYIAIVHGKIDAPMRIESSILRDRGDGIRGSGTAPDAQRAITHITPIKPVGADYTMIECRLETGRTHQIRIHLSEAGHMLCGETIYTQRTATEPKRQDKSRAPRQALHSASLRFTHPTSQRELSFQSELPSDLSRWLERLTKEV